MASPQLQNGYTKIANEVLEKLIQFDMPREVWKVVWTVIRKTWGYNKKSDWISLSQFCYLTGLQRPNICRGLRKAINMKLIIRTDNGKIKKIAFNKDFSTWKPLSVEIIVAPIVIPTDNGIIPTDNKSLSVRTHTKETIQKKTIQKKRIVFQKPQLEEVKSYCLERNNQIDPEAFIDFYESKGWKVGNQSMKDWKAAVRTWEKRTKKFSNVLPATKGKYEKFK